MRKVVAATCVLLSVVMACSGSASAAAGFLPRSSCYASNANPSYPSANLCDNNDGTRWVSSASNPYTQVNLTGSWYLTGVNIHFDANLPSVFNYTIWNGTVWFSIGSFVVTAGMSNAYAQFNLSASYTASKVRLWFTGAAVGIYEARPQGLPVPTVTAPAIDYTPIWILTALVVLLFLVGTKLPFIWIFAGIAGLLLAIQLLNTLADHVLSTVIAGFGVMLMIAGIFRRG